METVRDRQAMSDLEYFMEIMKKYFRKTPPIPTNMYLSGEVLENPQLRIDIARHCHFPAVLNILANDENEKVRTAARESEYWMLVGKYQDILGFGKRERKAFARNEGRPNVFILLMFDEDAEVLTEALHNPTVSLKMVILFLKLLQERGQGRKDEQLYEIGRRILQQRKQQIIKIATINKAAEEIVRPENVREILKFMTDSDHTVRKSIANILNVQDAAVLRNFINAALEDRFFESNLEHFTVLSALIKIIKHREDLKKISVSAIKAHAHPQKEEKFNSVSDFFLTLLTKKRLSVVKQSAADLTDFENIILMARCHVDSDLHLRQLAVDIMPIEDILALLNEVTTPRRIFKRILNILENHMDENVQAQVRETYLAETLRLRESLKELELTVQAYFDIIFQSLGYNKINEYMNVVRAINATRNQLSRFDSILRKEMGDDRDRLEELLGQVKKHLKVRANVLYFDTGPKVVHEMESIFDLINEIFKLKEMGLAALRPGTPKDAEEEIMLRAGAIWQSAISSYLGRIKDLTEMIRKKIIKVAGSRYGREELVAEMEEAMLDLENSYKESVSCQLSIRCKTCTRRGCAAERFLREAHFFIKEFLDNFAAEEV